MNNQTWIIEKAIRALFADQITFLLKYTHFANVLFITLLAHKFC